jgi:hypothetical protein
LYLKGRSERHGGREWLIASRESLIVSLGS